MRTSRYVLLGLLLLTTVTAYAGEPILIPVKIDGPVHDPANHTYWFGPFRECASVLDVDNDGDLDIASGRNWYEAPEWVKHANFRDGAETNGPETDDNSEFAMDVNFDGRTDIVSSGWIPARKTSSGNPGEFTSLSIWKESSTGTLTATAMTIFCAITGR